MHSGKLLQFSLRPSRKQDSQSMSIDALPSPRQGFLKFGALLVSVVLGLVTAETSLRAIRPKDRFLPYHANSVKVFHPDESITPGVNGTSQFTVNSLGTRGPELNGQSIRLLTIGGSTTACTVLDDDEEWAHLLMEAVNSQSGIANLLWVTNSGIDGLNSQHHLMHAIHLLPTLPRIDFVVVYAGLNDVGMWLYAEKFDARFLDDPVNRSTRIAESFRSCNYTAEYLPWYKHLETWKRLSVIKSRFLSARNREALDAGEIVQDSRLRWIEEERSKRRAREVDFVHKAKLETLPVAVAVYGSVLKDIAHAIRAGGSEPVFVAQALQRPKEESYEDSGFWMGAMDGGEKYAKDTEVFKFVEIYNQRMHDVCSQESVLFLHPPIKFYESSDYYYDGVHFNEEGAARFAEWLAEELLPYVLEKRNAETAAASDD